MNKTALISVSDKTGLRELVDGLVKYRAINRILASGGTSKFLRDNTEGVLIVDVSEVTKTPDLLGGRVKTLHPAIHGGILARTYLKSDEEDLLRQSYEPIDYVVCNLYPFEEYIRKNRSTQIDSLQGTELGNNVKLLAGAVEEIDIGGVTLLRAAAKNHERVTVLCDPQDYQKVLDELEENLKNQPNLNDNILSTEAKRRLAVKAFERTSGYDLAISEFFREAYLLRDTEDCCYKLPLKYGMNPHQKPSMASMFGMRSPLPLRVLNGQPGLVNLLDSLNGWALVKELQEATGFVAAASFKHVSPAGAALGIPLDPIEKQVYMLDDESIASSIEGSKLACAYVRARGADRMSSFGDWIALSETCDEMTARIISREVSDGIIAPGYTPEAFQILSRKKSGNFIMIEMDRSYVPDETSEIRQVYGICLEQPRNSYKIDSSLLNRIVSKSHHLPDSAKLDLLVATVALKYTQSNSVCFAYKGQVIGLGAGQQSRIHCTRLAGDKADHWWLRHHPRVRSLRFRDHVKRPERANAIDTFVTNTNWLDDREKKDWESLIEPDSGLAGSLTYPQLLTLQERREWLNQMKEVALSSDAFFPFSDNIHRAARSGVRYILAPSGSIQDEQILVTADAYNMTYIHTDLRLFHH